MAKTSSWLAGNLRDCIVSNNFQQWLPDIPRDTIDPMLLACSGVELQLVRLDALCPHLGGNKIFKLFGHLRHYFKTKRKMPIASFGGAHSNHLYALARACDLLNIPCIGFVRGEQPQEPSATLEDLAAMGMELRYLSRSDYHRRSDTAYCQSLGSYYWVPEGGGGALGMLGCVELGRFLAQLRPDAIVLACGTGTTYAGLCVGVVKHWLEQYRPEEHCPERPCLPKPRLTKPSTVVGISALKGGKDALQDQVCALISDTLLETSQIGVQNFIDPAQLCDIRDDFHCGGFARYPAYLADFVTSFEAKTGILLDPVYTAKMMWGIKQLCGRNVWPPDAKVIAIHSGGLQGRRGHNL